MGTATGVIHRTLPAYMAALTLVVGLVLMAPGLEDRNDIVLFLMAVVILAALPLVFSSSRRTTVLLGLFAFVVPFSGVDKWFFFRLHNGGSAGVQLSIADLVMLILYAVWVLESLRARKEPAVTPMPLNGVLLAGLGFIALSAISLVSAVSPELTGFELWQTAKLLLWSVYLAYNVSHVTHLRALGAGITIAVVVHAVFAAAEKLTGGSLGLGILGEQQGVTVGLLAGQYTRAGGLIGHPVLLGAFFAITLPFLLAVIAAATKPSTRAIGVAAVVMSLGGLALTLSRGAIIAWAFSFGFFVTASLVRERLKGKARDVIVGLVIVLLVAAVTAAPVILDRFIFSDPGSVSGRQQLNQIALRMIADNPVFGVGLNNWPNVMAAYDTTGISLLATDPVHNLYLLLWAEVGLLGLAGFLVLVLTMIMTAYRGARRAVLLESELASLAAVTALLAILIMGLASWELRLTPEHQLFWCIGGLSVAMERMAVRARAGRTVPRSQPGPTGDTAVAHVG